MPSVNDKEGLYLREKGKKEDGGNSPIARKRLFTGKEKPRQALVRGENVSKKERKERRRTDLQEIPANCDEERGSFSVGEMERKAARPFRSISQGKKRSEKI